MRILTHLSSGMAILPLYKALNKGANRVMSAWAWYGAARLGLCQAWAGCYSVVPGQARPRLVGRAWPETCDPHVGTARCLLGLAQHGLNELVSFFFKLFKPFQQL